MPAAPGSPASDCPFCAIVAGTAPAHRLYEDGHTLAFLDRAPLTRGHALVIPKQHARTLLDITPVTAGHLMAIARDLAERASDTLQPDGFTLIQANEPAGWQSVFHVHVHVIPRWLDDGVAAPPASTHSPDDLAALATLLELRTPSLELRTPTEAPGVAVTIDCRDPARLVRFWCQALGYLPEPPPSGYRSWLAYWQSLGVPAEELIGVDHDTCDSIVDTRGVRPRIWFQVVPEAKQVKNRVHLDIDVTDHRMHPLAERQRLVDARVKELVGAGAAVLHIRAPADTDYYAVVLADPEGNEFCVS